MQVDQIYAKVYEISNFMTLDFSLLFRFILRPWPASVQDSDCVKERLKNFSHEIRNFVNFGMNSINLDHYAKNICRYLSWFLRNNYMKK